MKEPTCRYTCDLCFRHVVQADLPMWWTQLMIAMENGTRDQKHLCHFCRDSIKNASPLVVAPTPENIAFPPNYSHLEIPPDTRISSSAMLGPGEGDGGGSEGRIDQKA